MNIKQLKSKYVLIGGVHCVEYQLQAIHPYIFTDLKCLWEDSLGETKITLSNDRSIVTYTEKVHSSFGNRATKYTDSELKFIFGDVITLPSNVVTPDKYKV